MRLISLLFLVLYSLMPNNSFAQNNFFNTYSYAPGTFTTASEPGRCVRQLASNDYLLLGITDDDLSLIKLDIAGQLIWSKLYTFSGHGFHTEQFIEVSNGDVLIVGSAYAITGHRTIAIRVDPNGNVIWGKIYEYAGGGGPIAFSVTETSTGNFAIVGQASTLFIINSIGDIVSPFGVRAFQGMANGFDDIETTSDGGLIMTGQPSGPIGSYDVSLVKTDQNGNVLWQKFFGGTDHDWGGAGVAQTADGGYIVSGSTESFGVNPGSKADMYMVKTDSLGNLLWSKTYGTSEDDMARGCVIASDNGYLMVGYKEEGGGAFAYDILILKTDSLGNFEWARTFDHLDMDGSSFVDLTADGGFIFTGGGINSLPWSSDIYVVKTDSMGIISNSCHEIPLITVTSPPTQEVVVTNYSDTPFTGSNITVTMLSVAPLITVVCCDINSSGLVDLDVCEGDNINLISTPTGIGPFTYEWLYEGVSIAGATDSTYTVLAASLSDSGMYSCIVTNACGTSTTDAMVLVSSCSINVSLLSDTICEGECVDLMATVTSSAGSVSYLWDQGITDTIPGPITVCPISTTNYTVIATDSAGFSDTVTATITVLSQPIVFLGNDTTLCSGSWLLDAQNPGATCLWQDSSNNQTLTVTTTGTYWVQVGNGGCITSDTIDVAINAVSVYLGPDIETCTPSSIILDAQNTGSTYLWQDSSTNQILNVSTLGTYWVEVTNGGCTAVDSIEITQGSITVVLPNDTLLCTGNSLFLDAQNPGLTYNWSDGSIAQSITINAYGIYWVEVTEGNCSATDSIVVDYYMPLAFFSVMDTVGCAPVIVSFTDLSTTPTGTVTSWLWDFGDGHTSNQQNPTHNYGQSGVNSVSLTVTTSDGCQTSYMQHVQVLVYPIPIAAFTITPSPAQTGEEVFFIDESINAQTWLWDFGNETNSTIQSPTQSYDDFGNYNIQLIVSNENCTDSFTINLIVEEDLLFYIPNSFTPDGDEFNNTFSPIFTTGFDPSDYHLMIFNRWGQLIFESFNDKIGWDGTYRGSLVQDGSYTWKIEFGDINNDKRHMIYGHVNMLK